MAYPLKGFHFAVFRPLFSAEIWGGEVPPFLELTVLVQ